MAAVRPTTCALNHKSDSGMVGLLPSVRRRTTVMMAARGSEEWEMNGAGGANGGGLGGSSSSMEEEATATGDDWYMDTGRIRYLREMEKLGQELHDLSGATGDDGGNNLINSLIVSTPGAPATPQQLTEHEKAVKEAMDQEEMRRVEVMVAESCATNWREEPVFSRPVGFVPGNRKVQQVKLSDNRVMYGSDSGVVGLASALDGRDLFRVQAHTALVTALDYDATTGWMLSAADDGIVKVHRDLSGHAAVGQDGTRAHTHSGAAASVKEIGQGMRHHSNRVVAAEILDHRWGMTASMDGKIVIFELDGGAVVQEIWASDTLLAASVCKGYIFVGLMSGVCEAFSIRNGGRSAFRYIAQRTPIRSLATFPLAANNIKVVAGGQDGALRQFHVRPVMSTEGVWKVPSDRSFDDRLVLLCNTHVDHETREVDQGFILKGHKGPVVAVACDEEKVVSVSEDGSIIVWDASKSAPCYAIRKHVDGDMVGAVDFNERYLVNDGTPGKVMVWDFAYSPPPRKAPGMTQGRSRRTPSPASSRGSRGSSQHRPARKKKNPPAPHPPAAQNAENGEGGLNDNNLNGGGAGGPAGGPRPFPFIGGWNLGHGPTDLNGVGGLNDLTPPQGAMDSAD